MPHRTGPDTLMYVRELIFHQQLWRHFRMGALPTRDQQRHMFDELVGNAVVRLNQLLEPVLRNAQHHAFSAGAMCD